MYTLTLARQLQFGQVQDESRPPIWKQILLHFMMDKDYTWSALKHKKHVLNRIESNAYVLFAQNYVRYLFFLEYDEKSATNWRDSRKPQAKNMNLSGRP